MQQKINFTPYIIIILVILTWIYGNKDEKTLTLFAPLYISWRFGIKRLIEEYQLNCADGADVSSEQRSLFDTFD